MTGSKKTLIIHDANYAKEMAFFVSNGLYGTDALLADIGEKMMPRYVKAKGKEKKLLRQDINTKNWEAMMAFGTETHVPLAKTFNVEYQRFVKTFTDHIIAEYDCKTHLEKSLAETIANAYVRNIDNSRRLNNLFSSKTTTSTINQYIALMSKQIDRANRQYLSAIFALKQLKAPQIEMNIKTQNAFISNNQQINAVVNRHEIISST